MMKRLVLLLIAIFAVAVVLTPIRALAQNPEETTPPTEVSAQDEPTVTPTPTPTNTSIPPATSTYTPVPTSTPTNTPIPPATPTPLPTATPIPTNLPTSTPTVTPIWPTDTPTPLPTATPTSTAGPTCTDAKEPNDQPGSGPVLTINQPINNLTLYPLGDVDFFMFWGKVGKYYSITTNTNQGVDTRVRVFDPAGNLLAENDDYLTGNPASQAYFQAPVEGWFMITADSRVPTAWDCRQYGITAVDVSAPTATPTRTPGPPPTATSPATAIPGEKMFDQYEPNYDFSTAANIGVGQTLQLNFNPWPAGSNEVDNDYFRFYVKIGEQLKIETTGLVQGLDTNLILFRDNGQVIAGNDDCQEGDRSSCLEWAPDYTGVAYIVAGPVGTIPEGVSAGARTYNLAVTDRAGQAATPVAGGAGFLTPVASLTPQLGLPWAVTPVPAIPMTPVTTTMPGQSPFGTPTPEVQVRPIAVPGLPTPTLPPMKLVTIGVNIFYDENNNRAPDASEGVSGISIRLLDGVSNSMLGQTFTNSQGHAALTVTAVGKVRLSIPYLGYNQSIEPPGEEVSIRLAPLRLPSLIP